jgi:NAD(P)-dependent dehydrogenase (short-subunit alcohol dehydrogenase family)
LTHTVAPEDSAAVTISNAVLITGCSSGIGRETAKLLAGHGRTVYATARRLESIADLEAWGCKLLELDVTDEDSAKAAVDAVAEAEGAVGVMINNAGINELGAIETVPLDRVRRIFETNLFGMIRMCQLVLPGMRAQGAGRIVNVGSMNGRFTFPGMGTYCATKHAMEAVSDALRHEVRPFGVHVSLIEPGMVKTTFGNTAAADRGHSEDTAYAAYNEKIAETAASWQEGSMAKLACGPEDVAEAIQKAVVSTNPRARYMVAPSARLMLGTRKVLPDSAFDAFIRTQFPSPEPSTKG